MKTEDEMHVSHYVSYAKKHESYLPYAVETIISSAVLMKQLQKLQPPGLEQTAEEIRARISAIYALRAIKGI